MFVNLLIVNDHPRFYSLFTKLGPINTVYCLISFILHKIYFGVKSQIQSHMNISFMKKSILTKNFYDYLEERNLLSHSFQLNIIMKCLFWMFYCSYFDCLNILVLYRYITWMGHQKKPFAFIDLCVDEHYVLFLDLT